MKIQYLEIVTPDVDAVCETYALLHDVEFGESDQNLGGARTAKLANGGMLGVRATLRDTEKPVVRHYMVVEDIQATVDAAAKSGAEVALPPMELAGHVRLSFRAGLNLGFGNCESPISIERLLLADRGDSSGLQFISSTSRCKLLC